MIQQRLRAISYKSPKHNNDSMMTNLKNDIRKNSINIDTTVSNKLDNKF